jgi:hypothetical protein
MSAQTSIEAYKKQSTSNTASKSIPTTRGLLILLAGLTTRNIARIFLFCHYFAITKQLSENESCYQGRNEMAGLKGKSGPPGNMNSFKPALAAIQRPSISAHFRLYRLSSRLEFAP